jgi:hypothetical protein
MALMYSVISLANWTASRNLPFQAEPDLCNLNIAIFCFLVGIRRNYGIFNSLTSAIILVVCQYNHFCD